MGNRPSRSRDGVTGSATFVAFILSCALVAIRVSCGDPDESTVGLALYVGLIIVGAVVLARRGDEGWTTYGLIWVTSFTLYVVLPLIAWAVLTPLLATGAVFVFVERSRVSRVVRGNVKS